MSARRTKKSRSSGPPQPDASSSSTPPLVPERTAIALIRALQAGELAGANLAVDERQRCVEHLWGRGYEVPEIAEILGVSQRTIFRDRKEIHAANAIKQDPKMLAEMVGYLFNQAESTIAHARRLAADRETPPAVRLAAESACWTVAREMVQSLQSLGYLPSAKQAITAEVTHKIETEPDYSQMQQELERLESILRNTTASTGTEPVLGEILSTKQQVAGLAVQAKVTALSTRVISTISKDTTNDNIQ